MTTRRPRVNGGADSARSERKLLVEPKPNALIDWLAAVLPYAQR